MVQLMLSLQLSLALLRFAVQGATPAETKAKLAVEELEKRWLAAANNIEALQVILAEDFLFVSPAGPVGKEQWIARVKERPATDSNESLRFDDLHIRVYGEVAVVNGTIVGTALRHNSTSKAAFTDIFIYRDGRWQVINSQQTAMSLPVPK